MPGDVRDFYRGKKVLLTGGTGFFGKMITEKLLRSCDVDGIYLIMRPKMGLAPDKRLQNMFEEPIFERTQKSVNKVHAIEGDLTRKTLGLREEDREFIRKNINVVFHCGASLNMDSKLSDAVITNVRGTSEVLDVLRDSFGLRAFVLVSTAYSNCYRSRIGEEFYETPIEPELLIKMTEELRPDVLDNISQGLIGKWPNCYVYTKAVAENLLLKNKGIPVGLFRPAIVTSTAFEPVPGWSDNLYGPLGILLSSHCGILRVLRANGNIRSHTIPGDMCINALLCFAWDVNNKWHGVKRPAQPPVVNFSAKNTKLLMPMKLYVDPTGINYSPFKKAMWYQMLFLVEMRQSYIVLKFLLHTLPSYIVDSLLVLSCKKPRMGKIYSKLHRISDVLCYFLTNEWDIDNDRLVELWGMLDEEEKAIFNFDIDSLDLSSYFANLLTGLKRYILKEDMTKAENHKGRYKRLTMLHFALKYSLMGFASYKIYKGVSRLMVYKRRCTS